NEIVDRIDSNSNHLSMPCRHYISVALSTINFIKGSKLSLEKLNQEVELIEKNIKLFKRDISTKSYLDKENPFELINYAEKVTEDTESKIKYWQDRLGLVDVNSIVSTMREFIKYCAANSSKDSKNIVDMPGLLKAEKQSLMTNHFNELFYYLSDGRGEVLGSSVASISKLEELLYLCQESKTLDVKNNDELSKVVSNKNMSKIADELYQIEPYSLMPEYFINQYHSANETLHSEITSSLTLSRDDLNKFREEIPIFLEKIYQLKLVFLLDYVKCFNADKAINNETLSSKLSSLIIKIKDNNGLTDDVKKIWGEDANQKLGDASVRDFNRQFHGYS
uniref:hypothetical protein n=1 Tax=Yersinia bercovieri TaxID=634 RepID=UPI0016439EDD